MRLSQRRRQIPFYIFVGIMLLALIQSCWWLIYQTGEGQRYRELQMRVFEERAQLAERELALKPDPLSEAEQAEFLERHPGLTLMRSNRFPGGFEPAVAGETLERIWADSASKTRMFLYEGAFFTLLILGGVALQWLAHRRLGEAADQQSNFVAAVTHELKSPLTSIRLYTELLAREDLEPAARRRSAEAALEDADRLNRLVEQILQARTLDVRDARLDFIVLDLGEFLEDWTAGMRERVAARGRNLVLVEPGRPLPVLVDPEALSTVLTNLVDNAVKYSPGGTEIRLGAVARGRYAELALENKGVGFESGENRRLFERFYRTGSELTRKTPGTGLGLYIVRELLRAMKGRAGAESEGPGKGARFLVHLPLHRS